MPIIPLVFTINKREVLISGMGLPINKPQRLLRNLYPKHRILKFDELKVALSATGKTCIHFVSYIIFIVGHSGLIWSCNCDMCNLVYVANLVRCCILSDNNIVTASP